MSDFLNSLLSPSSLWAFFLVVLFFGGSIFVHELGHFLAARRRGVHVERFSIGFGPAIWSWRARDGVEYRVSWLPLGGYVLLPQLADLGPIEGESVADVSKLPPVGYATKMIVFAAGATFNILFAFALACIVWVVGQPTFSELATTQIGSLAATVKLADGTVVPSPAVEGGLQPGDTVVSIDGSRVTNFEDILSGVFLGKQRTNDGRRKSTFVIERAGKQLELTIYPRLVDDEGIRTAGIYPAEDMTVELLAPGSPAQAAGVLPGDRIVAIDGQPVYQRSAVSDHIVKNAERAVMFTFQRGDKTIELPIQPRLELDKETNKKIPRIGVQYRKGIIVTHPNPFGQIAENVTGTFKLLDALLSPSSDIGPSKLSGPIGIARELHRQAQWDFRRVLWFTILLNVSLAIFNLLPIPVLDGGQMLFATVARLRGRPLPVNFIVTTQSVFMVLFFAMFVYVTIYGDLRRWMRDFRAERAEAAAPAVPATSTPAPAK
ncbi:MAG TPA: RIP metalloprotease RseP [Opitutaceae bacterium]|nr:RIP metalloprotease RseP [Opitutaceae bacterium]